MARLPRLTVPGYPHHIIQRGNNRQPIFASTEDFQKLLALLEEFAKKFGVAIHSYVLMSNHFHLLATPDSAEGVPRMMQALGRSYVRYFNSRHGRTGTLWEGRYRSTLIQADRYLLACMVYIDLNPVRAGMVADPSDYPWSSHLYYVGRRPDKLITPHTLFWNLGNTPFARDAAYAELVHSGIDPEKEHALTSAVLSGWALGEPDHLADLQRRTERRLAKTPPGRPRRAQAS
jgi:putative transposase